MNRGGLSLLFVVATLLLSSAGHSDIRTSPGSGQIRTAPGSGRIQFNQSTTPPAPPSEIDTTLESTNNATDFRTNCVVSKPANTVDGDFLVAYVAIETETVTPPAGWTEIHNLSNGTFHAWAYWKRASSEPSTWTFSHAANYSECGAKRFTGVAASGDPLDATPTANTGTGTTATMTGLTTATDGAALLGYVAGFVVGADFSSWSSPLTEYQDGTSSGFAAGVQTTAGASGNKTATISGTVDWMASLIALKPQP